MVIAEFLMYLQGAAPLRAYTSLFNQSFGSTAGVGTTLGKATPLVLSGLAVTIGLRAGLFNIGAQGQLVSGALATAWAAYAIHGLPPLIHVPLALSIMVVKQFDIRTPSIKTTAGSLSGGDKQKVVAIMDAQAADGAHIERLMAGLKN